MFRSSGKFVRYLIFGVALLVGLGTNPVGVNFDDDADDPVAVAVEMTRSNPCSKAIQRSTIQSWSKAVSTRAQVRISTRSENSKQGPSADSSPLIIPLRT